jgi:hypothetical protein
MRKILSVLFICLLALPLAAQQRTGNLYGKVVDQDSVPLPGVNVTLTSPGGAPMVQTTNNEGNFRFLSLPPSAEYEIKAELEGFKTRIEQRVIVNIGRNTELIVTMELGALEEEVTVVATTPTVTPKRTEVSHTMDREQLMALPSARDPWVVIQMIPGMLMDRENIGGSESGQQSSFVAKGETTDSWVMDGIQITDMNAIASPGYYDFDIFEEISVTTGMPDVENRERAMVVNMVTRRGQNRFGFGGRFFLTDEAFQWAPKGESYEAVKEVFSEENGYASWAGSNIIKDIKDFGFNMGGPLVQDKVWWWMSYGVQLINTYVITGNPDNTQLNNYAGKLNFQLIPDNRAEIFVHLGDKKKQGRDSTSSVPSGYAQHGKYHWGSPILKLQDEHMFGDNLFLSGRYGFTDAGFGMWPQTDEDITLAQWYDQDNAIYKDPWGTESLSDFFFSGRPHQFGLLQAIYYNDNLLGASHEIKLGLELNNNQRTYVGGNGGNFRFNHNYYQAALDLDGDGDQDIPVDWIHLRVGNNDFLFEDGTDRYAFYLQDIITAGRLTLNLQVRFDRVKDYREELTTRSLYLDDVEGDWKDNYYELTNEYFSNQAAAAISNLLVDRTRPYVEPPSDYLFWTISPRLGASFDLLGNGKTIIKAAFALYPGGPLDDVRWSPGGVYPWMSFWWNDQVSGGGNGDYVVQLNELYWAEYNSARTPYRVFDDAGNFIVNDAQADREYNLMWGGFDWDDPTSLERPYDYVDPNWKHGNDFDVLIAVEQEVVKDFGVAVNFTLRWDNNYTWDLDYYPEEFFPGLNNHIRSKDDYEIAGQVPDFIYPDGADEIEDFGASISTADAAGRNWYVLKDEPWGNQSTPYDWVTNRPDRRNNYWGIDLIWNKRYSNKWMLSGSFTIQNQTAHYGDGYLNPTSQWAFEDQMFTNSMGGGSGKISVPMFTRWMFKLQGMYSLPLGFDVSFSLSGREGMLIDEYFNIRDYSLPNSRSYSTDIELYANNDEARLKDVWVLNLKLQKRLTLGDLGSVWLSADMFNALNNQTLNRQRDSYYGNYRINYTPARFYPNRRFAEPNESLNPLIFRLGVRFQF